MKLTEYAKQIGVNHRTARRWYHDGLIEGAYQLPTGTIIVPDTIFKQNTPTNTKTVIYARVSNASRKNTDLEYQVERLTKFAEANGWMIDKIYKEIGSGLNDNRQKLNLILNDPTITRIIIEHKDRLTRFGFNYLETLLKQRGTEIVVVNRAQEDKEDLIEDLTSIITSFCARIYGQRRGKRKTEQLIKDLEDNAKVS